MGLPAKGTAKARKTRLQAHIPSWFSTINHADQRLELSRIGSSHDTSRMKPKKRTIRRQKKHELEMSRVDSAKPVDSTPPSIIPETKPSSEAKSPNITGEVSSEHNTGLTVRNQDHYQENPVRPKNNPHGAAENIIWDLLEYPNLKICMSLIIQTEGIYLVYYTQ